jgi:hypothetical protein
MANPFIKSFLFINIISNIFLYINCEDYNITCEKMIINKNGTITNDKAKAKKNYTTFSIYNGESFIIYYCYDNKTNLDKMYCMSYYNNSDNNKDIDSIDNTPSPSSCMKKKTNDEDSICCHYRKKIIDNGTKVDAGCIELNKYEIERFKWNIPDPTFYSYNETNNIENKSIIQFECESELFKLNKYIFLIFFIIFFNY